MINQRWNRRTLAVGLVVAAAVSAVPAGKIAGRRMSLREAAKIEAQKVERPPAAADLMERFIGASGGREAFGKIHSRVATGRISMPALGVEGPISVWQAEREKSYSEARIEGLGLIRSGSDGEVYWESNAMTGPRILTGVEREVTRRLTMLNAELEWSRFYPKGECVGVVDLGGVDAYEVRLIPAEGQPITLFLGKDSGLLMKTTLTLETPMGEIPTVIEYADYREAGGLRLPFRMTQKALEMEQVISLDTIEHNVAIPADRFALPSEIEALLSTPTDDDAARPAAAAEGTR